MTDPFVDPSARGGPLAGVRVIDVSALGPGPFCSMLLADHGADVIAIERPRVGPREPSDVSQFFNRGKQVLTVDLRAAHGTELLSRLAESADVFLEGYRPGTMERRGLGPEVLLARNPRLVYTRLTGWGQTGPYSRRAGHDIDYIAVGGVLGVVGAEAPVPPLNLLGDFASGSLLAALGTLLALFERSTTGRGQVVDAAMVDGSALLLSAQLAEHSRGIWRGRGHALLSGHAPFYGVYKCADCAYVAVGAIEPKFYAELLGALGWDPELLHSQYDESQWSDTRARMAAEFKKRSRAEWSAVFAHWDACVFPVLDVGELAADPHLRARGTVVAQSGQVAAAPAPRLSDHVRTAVAGDTSSDGTRLLLEQMGLESGDIDRYLESGTLQLPSPLASKTR